MKHSVHGILYNLDDSSNRMIMFNLCNKLDKNVIMINNDKNDVSSMRALRP